MRRARPFTLGALVALASLLTRPLGATTHLIVVANNLGHPEERELHYAEHDAERFRDVLLQVGAFDAIRERLLLGGDAAALQQLLDATAAKADDTLIVYYSGHADADGLHLGSSTLPFPHLKALVEQSSARVKLLVVDACLSGLITQGKGARPAPPFAIGLDDRVAAQGTAIVTSSADSEESQESEQLRGSFFTHHLLNGLLGAADDDRDLTVTLQEAYAYAYRETVRSSGRTRSLQHPTYSYALNGRGKLVISRLGRAGDSALLAFALPGHYFVFDRSEALVAELTTERPEAYYRLPAGQWLIQRREAEGANQYAITLSPGQTVLLAEQAATWLPLASLGSKGRGGDEGTRLNGVQLLGGAYGSPIAGYGATRSLWLGYGRDVAALEVGLDARVGYADDYTTYGLRLRVEYAVPLGLVSLGAGLAVEGTRHLQSVPHAAAQNYAAIGALGFAEVAVSGATGLRVEGGPILHLLRRVLPDDADQLATPWAWWLAAGPTLRF